MKKSISKIAFIFLAVLAGRAYANGGTAVYLIFMVVVCALLEEEFFKLN